MSRGQILMTELELKAYMPFLINRAGSRLADSFSKVLERHSLSVPMWRVLVTVHDEEGLRAGQLAALTSVEPWTASRLLKDLVKKNLIRRVHESEDARAVTIYPTEKGRQIVTELIPHALHLEATALKGFTSREIKQLQKMLARLYENLNQTENTPQEAEA